MDHETDATRSGGPSFPLSEFLGMRIRVVEEGWAVASLEVTSTHHNPNGVVHGAVLFAMVDTAMGGATVSALRDGQYCASIDVQLRFLKPASDGELEATAQVLRAGRRVVHLDARVRTSGGELVATATGAFAVLE